MRLAAFSAAVVVIAAAAAALAGAVSSGRSSTLTVCQHAPTSPRLFDAVIAQKPIEPFLRSQHPRLVRARWLTDRLGRPRRVAWLTPVLARWRYGTTVYCAWHTSALKETVYWFVGTGIVLAGHATEARPDPDYVLPCLRSS